VLPAVRLDQWQTRIAKGKVESGVGHAQKTPLKGMRFESPREAQAYLDHWEARWADTRIHGATKRQVATMFAEERPALLPLPIEPASPPCWKRAYVRPRRRLWRPSTSSRAWSPTS
jgi:hypothetical protein